MMRTDPSVYVTIGQAARALRIPARTVKLLLQSGQMRGVKGKGGRSRWLVPVEEVERWREIARPPRQGQRRLTQLEIDRHNNAVMRRARRQDEGAASS